jgi:CSLREA domain-containing protein
MFNRFPYLVCMCKKEVAMNQKHFQRMLHFSLGLSLLLGSLAPGRAAMWVRAAPGVSFTVNSTADADDAFPGDGDCETGPGNGICTLRAAIREANAFAGADTITLPAGTYTLTLVGSDDIGAAGDLDITGDLTINGAGYATTIIDANSATTNDRALDILHNTNVVSISGVTVRNGKAPEGGGIRSAGLLTISNCLFTTNEAVSAEPAFVKGGTIYSNGSLTVSDSTFSLNKATATDENAYGGAIFSGNPSSTWLTNVVFEGNLAKGGSGFYGAGGAFYNWGIATLVNCTFSSNEAANFLGTSFQAAGGGIYNNNQMSIQGSTLEYNSAQGYGGGIDNTRELHIRTTTVRDGKATWGGGVSTLNLIGQAVFESTTISGNTATESGGGIYSDGMLTLLDTTLQNNQAKSGGGLHNRDALTIQGSLIKGNIATSLTPGEALGGGILNNSTEPANIIQTAIGGNQAEYGGGIYQYGTYTMTLSYSTVHDNQASSGGGGIYNNSILIIWNSTFSGNLAGVDGGGLRNLDELHIVNSTFSSNAAGDDGGGLYNDPAGHLNLSNLTITLNKADADSSGAGNGGGLFNSGGNALLYDSLIAGNLDLSPGGMQPVDCVGALSSGGYNLLGDNTGCTGLVDGVNGDQVGTLGDPINPMLLALADNGGPTSTHLPLASSPVIDAGNPAGCYDSMNYYLFVDQRVYWRPVDGDGNGTKVCDIGAVEYLSVVVRILFLPLLHH